MTGTGGSFSIEALTAFLTVGASLFAIGMLGFIARRNLIVMFLCAELMLQGVALTLVGFGRYHGNWVGQVFTIVILTVAACEAAIALALVLVLYNRRSTLDAGPWQEIREADLAMIDDVVSEAEPVEVGEEDIADPKLVPAGVEPLRVGPTLERRT